MERNEIRFWMNVTREIINKVELAISPLVGTKKSAEIVKMGADGTPTKLIDIIAEKQVIEVLKDTNRSLNLVSEEIGELKIGNRPSEVFFIVDPLDGTINATKKIPAYGISIAVVDATKNSPEFLSIQDVEIGMVKNLATGELYEAVKGKGAFVNGKKLIPSYQTDISRSSMGAYIYRADVKKIEKLCKNIRRMRILGSVAIELCYVADGRYDGFVDIRGNLRIVDIAAAKLIVEEVGGKITDQNGNSINGKLKVTERTSIIAASNLELHKELIKIIGVL
jgi:myo-inositol-1(or 4)-monophosphatase